MLQPTRPGGFGSNATIGIHGTYSTDYDAKKAAEHWEGPPPE
jgi:hypothetical protein